MYIGYPSPNIYPSNDIYPMRSLFDKLIYDRTLADVEHRNELKNAIQNGTATQSEIAEWNKAELKGAYNYTDLNRIGILLQYIQTEGANKGFIITYPYTIYTNYTTASLLTVSDVTKLLQNVATVKTTFAQWIATQVPSAIKNYEQANAIESILHQVESIYEGTEMAYRYSDEFYSGGDF